MSVLLQKKKKKKKKKSDISAPCPETNWPWKRELYQIKRVWDEELFIYLFIYLDVEIILL